MSRDGRALPRALVVLPLSELAPRLPGLRIEELAIFGTGRSPVPHALRDRDGDGRPDEVLVVVPVAAGGATRILATCPGPRSTEPFVMDGSLPTAAPDFAEARR